MVSLSNVSATPAPQAPDVGVQPESHLRANSQDGEVNQHRRFGVHHRRADAVDGELASGEFGAVGEPRWLRHRHPPPLPWQCNVADLVAAIGVEAR